ncbi:MAG: lytic transglycosylase domain-containing protein [Rhodobacteraceae bacterium]|jgi:soluble lytic murein transglycosylase-like protein|nr:lytic transglycosylase domain-containing protein [Paracoccaceae bacterium]
MQPRITRRALGALLLALPLAACGRPRRAAAPAPGHGDLNPNETPELRRLIEAASRDSGLPLALVQRVVAEESRHRPEARNGPNWGLMQIRADTARSMGYRGPPGGLLDAATNLRYGTRYLRGAWIVARHNPDRAVMWYRRGYYYEARRRGLLREVGLAG